MWSVTKIIGFAIQHNKHPIWKKGGWEQFCQDIVEQIDKAGKILEWKQSGIINNAQRENEDRRKKQYTELHPYTCDVLRKKK